MLTRHPTHGVHPMKNLLKQLTVILPLSILTTMHAPTSFAADEHSGHHPAAADATSPSVPAINESPSAMANMSKMREQMAAIRTTKDSKERAKLLDEHLQTMQATTEMMQQDKGCMMMSGGMAMKDGTTGTGGMNMMHMMMEQMMQHQKAMQTNGK